MEMVKRTYSIPLSLEQKFRDEVLKRYGYKKGNLSKALIEAIKMWIKWEENLTDDERKVMDAAIYPPQTD